MNSLKQLNIKYVTGLNNNISKIDMRPVPYEIDCNDEQFNILQEKLFKAYSVSKELKSLTYELTWQ